MNKKEFIVINCLVLSMVLYAGFLTLKLSINQDVKALAHSLVAGSPPPPAVLSANEAVRCSKKPALVLPAVPDAQLKALGTYQQACNSFATDKLMYFTGFPDTYATAQSNSTVMAAKLKLYSQAKVSPLVIAEPYAGNKLMSYRSFLDGKYDLILDAYFKNLKAAGITDQMMGTWVPFPESNTPNWDNKGTQPRDFALCVNKYLGILKKYFPGAKGSVLLSAATYEPNDLEWENGDYLSLVPYLQDIDKNLVSSFGMQGFPWVSAGSVKRREIFRASEFLQPDQAIAAAQELRTRDIWFNTGTFAAKYTNDSKNTVQISINERKGILDDVLDVTKTVQSYQQNAYRVSVNLFAEDKSSTTEATDWSYFQNSDSERVMRDFLARAEEAGVGISLFDQTK